MLLKASVIVQLYRQFSSAAIPYVVQYAQYDWP